MHDEHFVGLMGAYNFELQFRRPEECKTRFRGNGTFIDLWEGRRGVTVGVYDPTTSSMRYVYRVSPGKLEDVILKIKDRYELKGN